MQNNTTNIKIDDLEKEHDVFLPLGISKEDVDQRLNIQNIVAFVLFDGSLTGENVPLISFNISSVKRTATGTYTVIFKKVRRDSQYLVVGNSSGRLFVSPDTLQTNSFVVTTEDHAGTLTDASRVHLTVLDIKL